MGIVMSSLTRSMREGMRRILYKTRCRAVLNSLPMLFQLPFRLGAKGEILRQIMLDLRKAL